MKALTPKPSGQFGKKLENVTKGIDRALLWLESARETAPRLNMEADRLSVRLRHQHNKTARLAEAAGKECAVGFFGLAQAGKAWLIAALAASEKGRMEIALGNATFDYARLNPQQQNATLVMRFSGQQASVDNEWPVQLSLMSEEEIAGVLAQIWASRSGSETLSLDEQQIAERIKSVAAYRQAQSVEGMNSNSVVALWQRLNAAQICRGKALESHFWPQAVELAPMLGVDDRARLFSLLWNEDRDLSALYRQLAHVLHHLSGARRVLAPIATVDDPGLSVLNSSGLRYFNASSDRVIQVVPQHKGRSLKPVTLALGELNLLSREVLLPFYSAPRENLFEQVDLLDYPGFAEPSVLPDDNAHELALAFTSAKRPFLLTRAAERQDVDLLLVCNASAQRADTRTVGRVLDNWVRQSQPREGRKPALIWALTPFDQRITHGQNHDAAVQRYVGHPGEAWGTMLTMDDKGVKRMAGWLTTEVKRESKIARLQEQLGEIRRELCDNLLGRWYLAAEKEAPEARLRVAESLLKALQARTGVHGELLERLLPTRETLRHLFMQQQHPAERRSSEEYALTEDDPFGIGMSIDLLSDSPLPFNPQPAGEEQEAEVGFAQQVYRYWINLLGQLPEQEPLLELLGIARPTLEMLTEELTTASIRLDIEGALVKILNDKDAANTPAEMLADRQVSRALSVLGDFVAWLGFQHLPEAQRPESKINRGQKIFARPETQAASLGPTQRLTRLSLKPNNYAAWYIYDWLVGLNETILLNAGYSAAREIDGEHRAQLAAILKQI